MVGHLGIIGHFDRWRFEQPAETDAGMG